MANRKQVLIDLKEALEKVCENCCCDFEECKRDGFCMDYTNIEQLPTVEAVEVVHGRWHKPTPCSQEFCTNCGLTPKTNFGWLPPYCPNCGAKMDGGNEDE